MGEHRNRGASSPKRRVDGKPRVNTYWAREVAAMAIRTGIAPNDLMDTPTLVLQEMRAMLLDHQQG
jgi:hypothetical protein